jgi:SAM-dependent methyltransferase
MNVEGTLVARTKTSLGVTNQSVSLETVDCSFCGSPEYSLYDSVDEWRIVRCKRCGFYFTNPRPTIESLPSFYDMSYFRDDDEIRFGFFNQDGEPRSLSAHEYKQRIADIESYVEKRGCLLELGAAVGEFLSVMSSRGWKVEGVEVSRDAVEVAKRNHAVDIFCGNLEQFESSKTYDVVCMYHSLEHTPNPAYVIDRAYELLKPGGIIVIEVPNLKGFDSRINRERKLSSYDLPRHLSHFTPAILSNKLQRTGFEILDIDLYYPQFILQMAEQHASRRKRTWDRTPIAANDHRHDSPSGEELPMAHNSFNWKSRLFKRVSRLFPGWRFTIVARK